MALSKLGIGTHDLNSRTQRLKQKDLVFELYLSLGCTVRHGMQNKKQKKLTIFIRLI